MDNHEVACIIADLFGDNCACNFNGIDEWLPYYCDYCQDDELPADCPDPGGVACWEQYLKYRHKAKEINVDESETVF